MEGERILVVDDEPGVRAALESILVDEGFSVVSVENGEAGLAALEQGRFDAVLLDVWLPGVDGLETLRRLREGRCDAQVVMISGHGSIETAVRATKLGAFDFVEKPLSLEKTLLVVRNALRQRRLERRNRHLLQQLVRETEITGRSAGAERLRAAIGVATASDAPVLVTGEPGSGRESVARRIHSGGRFADGPFVEVPCGALSTDAARAALFDEPGEGGRIRMAASGSLYLEDVDRLDAALQAKLASTLDVEAIEEDAARTIASASGDTSRMDQHLRQSLDVIHIAVPALRERREDVPLMAERFMRDLAREYGREPKRLAPECLLALKAYRWPGNVRELKNLMERLLLFVAGDVVDVADLPQALGGATPPAEDLYREFASLAEGVEVFTRYYVARVLAEEGSDRDAAAGRLGISRSALDRRLGS